MAASGTAQKETHQDTSASSGNANRVWVGNLAYKSSEQELRDAFAGLKISEISLPERFGRRQGYAFVTFENPEDVEKAVAEVNGKELLGREMKVQKATSSGPYTSENGEHGDPPSAESRKTRPKPRAKATPRRTREAVSEEHTESADADPEAAEEQTARPRRRRFQTKAAEEGAVSEDAETSGDHKKSARKPLRKGPPEDGTPSPTTIYVANIPFEYTDDKLKELFVAYSPVSAYIVPRQIPRFVIRKLAERGEARKGRGFGFVTFADEHAQQKAVEEMNGREVEGRAISVKVAIDKPKEEKESDNPSGSIATNGAAPAS